MQTAHFASLNTDNKDFNGNSCAKISGYGYGLVASKDCRRFKRIEHGRALPDFGSNYIFYPDYGIGIIAFSNLSYSNTIPVQEIEKLLFHKAAINPRKQRIAYIREILIKAGKIKSIDKITPWNQWRGSFKMYADHGIIDVYIALNPESNPRIQNLIN